MGAVGKFLRRNLLPPLRFDAGKAEKSFLAASDIPVAGDLLKCSRRSSSGLDRLRHRNAGELARGSTESGIGSRPRSERPHAVVNRLSREGPMDTAVFFLEQGSERGFVVLLR